MKNIFFFALLMLNSTILLGQSYIEVKGEPDLSVYLNSKFIGKTTADLGGLIIENVTPGKNLIKIVKEGFTPFEETITVKPDEVLAYIVKPFAKHKVYVSEEGNTEETGKKAIIKTGKLVIQSVPIEIKITIPDIEGINKSEKTKDKWQADEIPEGNYSITFTYNQKVITKNIEVLSSETTSLFINMLSGDFKTSNSLDERETKEKALLKKGETEFMNYNPSNFKLGLSIEYTKKEYLELKLKINNNNTDELVSSDGNIKFYIKNGKVYGYTDLLSYKKTVPDDDFKEYFTIGIKKLEELNKIFLFSPTKQEPPLSELSYTTMRGDKKYSDILISDGFANHLFLNRKDGDKVSYNWYLNGKTVRLDLTFFKSYWQATYGHNITITILNENLVE